MRADDIAYKNRISSLAVSDLINECMKQKQRADAMEVLFCESKASMASASADYNRVLSERDKLIDENRTLKSALERASARNTLGSRELFGSSAEGLDAILSDQQTELLDPLDEDADDDADTHDGRHRSFSFTDGGHRHGSKAAGALKAVLDKLPRTTQYCIDIEALNREFGEYNWAIAYWHDHVKVEVRRATKYVHVTKTPVISVGLEHILYTLPYYYPLFQRSILTPSLMAEFLYNKFYLHLPFYRQEENMRQDQGFTVSRQTMIRWTILLACTYLWAVYQYLLKKEADCPYQNIDETYLRVLFEKGSHSGRKYYVWVFSTGMLSGCTPVIAYKYGPSRSADNLRELLGLRDYLRVITCDAFVAYKTIESEDRNIKVSGCMMHVRRRWVFAFEVLPANRYTDEQLEELIEVKALLLITDIYVQESLLKDLSPDDRKTARQEKVRPLLEKYLDFVHSLDLNDPALSEKARDAISYTLNQEEHLKLFLEDGRIPIDNGYAERNVKHIALGRRNWLFADTADGAKACCVFDTFVATAKANGANVYFYLKYLLEQVPNIPKEDYLNPDLMEVFMPWSESYREYERDQMQRDLDLRMDTEDPPAPKTPRKKDQISCA